MNRALDADAFDTLMNTVDPPLIIVTTAVGEERGGCLVGFHAQSSIDPERYSVWLSKANHTYRLALRSSHLAIHFLAEDQLPLAALFGERTGDDLDKFEGLATGAGPDQVPLLLDAPNRLVVRRIALLDEGGDHVCLTTVPIVAEAAGSPRPLRLSHASELVPGHSSEERNNPPTERAAD